MNAHRTQLTISVVLYKNKPTQLYQLVKSLLACTVEIDVYFIDNSPTPELSASIPQDRFHYHHNKKNVGYGAAHNQILKRVLHEGSFHLVMNADLFFKPGTLENIIAFMEEHPNIGLLLPRVLNPDGSDQPLYKLLPRPQDLITRRFVPNVFKRLFLRSMDQYKMAFADEGDTFNAPYLSGCFMFLRKKALQQVGLFDERFFLYCEDVDLSRRITKQWQTTYYSGANIYHYFYKGSYKHIRLLWHHMISAFKYFNKHGWFTDKERAQINEEAMKGFAPEKKAIMFPSTL